jgi:D-alanine-D-alanine ligase
MKKNIAIVAGGDSGEYEISIKSGEQCLKQIDRTKYNPFLIHIKGTDWKTNINGSEVQVDKNNFSVIQNGNTVKFDCVVIAIHGTPGEDGRLQSYFEMMKVPYTTCGVLSSSLAFNKYACKHYLMPYGINTARALLSQVFNYLFRFYFVTFME